MEEISPPQQLEIRARSVFNQPGLHHVQTCWVKEGGKGKGGTWKSVSLLSFGRSQDRLTHKELHVSKWTLTDDGFAESEHWYCRDYEVDRLQTFVNNKLGAPGDYAVMEKTDKVKALLEHIEDGGLSGRLLSEIAATLADHVEFVDDGDTLQGAELLGMAVDLKRQRTVTDTLESLVLDSGTTEPKLQSLLESNWWLFGGTYVEKVSRRKLTFLDEFDIPLIRADGVLHIIELKRANIANLVQPYRNHYRVGDAINAAVNQAANYLREVDELRDSIKTRFNIECRRAQATAIIGHPAMNNRADVTEQQVREAIRTYNSHLSRIEVLTYEDVLSTARQTTGALAEKVKQEAKPAVTTDTGWADDEEPF